VDWMEWQFGGLCGEGGGGVGAALAVQLLMGSFLPYFFAAAFGLPLLN
jgi:hypothetical protein